MEQAVSPSKILLSLMYRGFFFQSCICKNCSRLKWLRKSNKSYFFLHIRYPSPLSLVPLLTKFFVRTCCTRLLFEVRSYLLDVLLAWNTVDLLLQLGQVAQSVLDVTLHKGVRKKPFSCMYIFYNFRGARECGRECEIERKTESAR